MTTIDVLLVEDEPGWVEAITHALAVSAEDVVVTHARSRDSAFAAMEAAEFDLLICDLRLPADDGGLDTSEEHGFAVHGRLRELSPGTPCYFLTGFGTLNNLRAALAAGRQEDLFGDGNRWPLVDHFDKNELPECVDAIAALAAGYAALDHIAIDGTILGRDASALRIFARRHGASRVAAETVGGGLSSARTLTAKLYGLDAEDRRGAAFVKLARSGAIQDERERYQHALPTYLAAGVYAPLADEITAGLGRSSANFYSLADGYDRDLFDLITQDPETAALVVRELESRLEPWLGTKQLEDVQLGALRARRISDADFEPFKDGRLPVSLSLVEERQFRFRCCNQHGDLHAGNVLVGPTDSPLLIDYGDVGMAAAGLDPLTLELSLLFHPKSPLRGTGWATAEQVGRWLDLDAYVADCPVAPVIVACREWAMRCADHEQLCAVAYAHAARQLKYPDVDPSIAIAVLSSCVAALSDV
ncbi:MAG: hypothetical protein AMXMBFR23_15400 [Chloroflexota bacterium]